jgi:thiol-disulfide isomerase/thioredoxin
MSKKMKGWIFGLLLVAILAIPIIVDYVRKGQIRVIPYSEYLEVLRQPGFSLIYFGDTKSDSFDPTKETLLNLRDEFEFARVNVLAVNFPELDPIYQEELRDIFESETAYVFISDGRVVHVIEGETTISSIRVIINKYVMFIIPEEEVKYTPVTDHREFRRTIESRSTTMMVFGNDGCEWCLRFRVVFNDLLQEHDLRIHYANATQMDPEVWTAIMDDEIIIPGKCVQTNEDTPMSQGFGTPLTLFMRRGQVIDCISGYVGVETLTQILKEVEMLD